MPAAPKTFADLLADHSSDVQRIAERLRDVVFDVLPQAAERVYPAWGMALYIDDWSVCAIEPRRDRCRFVLTRGAHLHDPQGLLDGSGDHDRHVDLSDVGSIPAEALRDLILQCRLDFQKSQHAAPAEGPDSISGGAAAVPVPAAAVFH